MHRCLRVLEAVAPVDPGKGPRCARNAPAVPGPSLSGGQPGRTRCPLERTAAPGSVLLPAGPPFQGLGCIAVLQQVLVGDAGQDVTDCGWSGVEGPPGKEVRGVVEVEDAACGAPSAESREPRSMNGAVRELDDT